MHQILKKRYNFTLRWLLDLGNTSLEQNLRLKTLDDMLFIPAFFLSVAWLLHGIFGYCLRNSLTHLMLIIAFRRSIFVRKVTRRGSVSTSNWVPSGLWSQWHNPLTTHPKLQKILSPNLPPVSLKCGNTINALNAFKTVLAWDWSGL